MGVPEKMSWSYEKRLWVRRECEIRGKVTGSCGENATSGDEQAQRFVSDDRMSERECNEKSKLNRKKKKTR